MILKIGSHQPTCGDFHVKETRDSITECKAQSLAFAIAVLSEFGRIEGWSLFHREMWGCNVHFVGDGSPDWETSYNIYLRVCWKSCSIN